MPISPTTPASIYDLLGTSVTVTKTIKNLFSVIEIIEFENCEMLPWQLSEISLSTKTELSKLGPGGPVSCRV